MGKTRHCYHFVTVKSVAACSFFWGKANVTWSWLGPPNRRCSVLRSLMLCGRPAAGMVAAVLSPACDLGQLPFRACRDHLELAEIDLAAVAVDGDPVAGRNSGAREPGSACGHVDRHVTAADDTGL